MPITQAYAKATAEFVHLRARHEMATMAAEMEARHHGATFGPDPFVFLIQDLRMLPALTICIFRNDRFAWRVKRWILSAPRVV